MSTLTIEGLYKDFGTVRALSDINLAIADGQLVTLLGPSGCGKTTLLRCIAGILEQTGGEIRFGAKSMDGIPAERRNIGMVFQTYALFPHMTVFKNLSFGLEMRKVPKDEARRRIFKALEVVELAHLADRYPRELSGGQQQRVALGRAIVIEPEMLLFDEPLSNLDAKLRDSLREDLRNLQRKLGITSVYVTHDQGEAMALSDQVVLMDGGQIVEHGPPEVLYRNPRFRYTAEFIGSTNVVPVSINGGEASLPWGARRPFTGSSAAEVASLRAEDISIKAASTGDDFIGTIEDITFLGAATQYHVLLAGRRLRVVVSGAQQSIMPPGTSVAVSAPAVLGMLETHQKLGAA